jgi:glycerophosphoryl diester phosphodiesterase
MIYPRIVGHRGAAALAPENTLAGFRAAARVGARMVELDAKLSADGVVICHHDHELGRTSNGSGPVAAQSFAALRVLDAGGWFGPDFADERIPTLAEALDLIASLGMGVNVEIKPCPGRERDTAAATVQVVRDHWKAGFPFQFSSFKPAALDVALAEAPDLPRGYLTDDFREGWLEDAARLRSVSVNGNFRRYTKDRIDAVHAAGMKALAYTVNEPADAARLLADGMDILVTDCPDRLLAL